MSKKKILIIEDDAAIVDSIKALLKNEYDVDSAQNGNVGLEKVASFKPDLIILDLMMPEKDGFDVCKKLKADEALKSIPVIALSSFTELYGMSFTGDDTKSMLPSEIYLSKPLDPPTLLREIKEHIGG
jgi:putative two-component system response regulator